MDASVVDGGPPVQPPVRVLLVEDEADHARLVQRALGRAETARFTVERAANGAQALTLAAAGRYDALILDYRLPDMDGLELLGRLRAVGLHEPVLLLTGGGSEDLVARALRARVDDYLPKQVGLTGDVLPHALLAMLERRRLLTVEDRFGDLLQGLNGSIWEADPTTLAYTFVSRPTEAMLGYPLVHWSTQPNFFVKVLHPDDREHALTTARAAIAAGGEIDDEYRLLARDGHVVWVHSVVRVVADTVGHPRLLRGLTVDITERKLAELARDALLVQERALRVALEESQQQVIQQERLRALGEMASGIAHDFNNALAAILGYSELLLGRPALWSDTETVTRYLQMINTGAQDAASVVRRLREFARTRAPDEGMELVLLEGLVTEAVALTQPRWKDQALSEGRAITVQMDLGPVPPVLGNAADLREALTNLIFNAVDALPQGGTITLRTRAEDTHACLDVSDTGNGMSDEERRRCLEPFYSTKGEHGTGLGLAMVYGIIQRHDGLLDVESAPGQGTTFHLRFPLVTAPRAAVEAPASAAPVRPQRVLVVDDDTSVREITVAYLLGDGHTVDTACSGDEGLEKFQRGGFDLVITDYAMPGLTGEQLALAIKGRSPTMPVIMMTGFGDQLEAAETQPAGVDCLVSKPATLEELRRAVARVTRASREGLAQLTGAEAISHAS